MPQSVRSEFCRYVIACIIPMCIATLITFTTFAIEHKAAPARAMVCVVPFFSIVALHNGVTSTLPKGGSSTWLDNLALGCYIFAAVSLGASVLIMRMFAHGEQSLQHSANQQSLELLEEQGGEMAHETDNAGIAENELKLDELTVNNLDTVPYRWQLAATAVYRSAKAVVHAATHKHAALNASVDIKVYALAKQTTVVDKAAGAMLTSAFLCFLLAMSLAVI